jgi:hypothetical protein
MLPLEQEQQQQMKDIWSLYFTCFFLTNQNRKARRYFDQYIAHVTPHVLALHLHDKTFGLAETDYV